MYQGGVGSWNTPVLQTSSIVIVVIKTWLGLLDTNTIISHQHNKIKLPTAPNFNVPLQLARIAYQENK